MFHKVIHTKHSTKTREQTLKQNLSVIVNCKITMEICDVNI